MPKTFAALQADAVNYIQAPGDGEALSVAGSGINDAINTLNIRNWSFLETTYNFALTAGTKTYDAPQGLKAPRQLSYMDTSGNAAYSLGYLDPKTFERDNENVGLSIQGDADTYTLRTPYPSGVLELSTAPSADFISSYPSGILRYYARIPNLVNDTDELIVPPEVEHCITWYAKSYLAAVYNPSKVDFAEGRYQYAFRYLRRNETESVTSDWKNTSRRGSC